MEINKRKVGITHSTAIFSVLMPSYLDTPIFTLDLSSRHCLLTQLNFDWK